jgi:hypothetical protein
VKFLYLIVSNENTGAPLLITGPYCGGDDAGMASDDATTLPNDAETTSDDAEQPYDDSERVSVATFDEFPSSYDNEPEIAIGAGRDSNGRHRSLASGLTSRRRNKLEADAGIGTGAMIEARDPIKPVRLISSYFRG